MSSFWDPVPRWLSVLFVVLGLLLLLLSDPTPKNRGKDRTYGGKQLSGLVLIAGGTCLLITSVLHRRYK